MTEWTVKPGDALRVFSPKGDPRDPKTDLSQAYIVPDPFTLQPSYLSDFIATPPFSVTERTKLVSVLGKEISDTLYEQADRAINELVCTIALDNRLATWKSIESQLQLILDTCATIRKSAQDLISLTSPNIIDASVTRGALSADQLVKKMLLDQVDPQEYALKVHLKGITGPCTKALADIKNKIKKGRKPDTTFRLFLLRLINAMNAEGLEIKVPSNENVFDNVHPTFSFIIALLDIGVEKGKAAIEASALEAKEKQKAIKALSQYRKSTRSIVHYLRDSPLK
ncbi:hypothetical protein FPV16_14055 [Methylobacterium sp. W2]|uniref:hypothetical protein n=1 Tax=Methylobacterium sp. W2 TaxID=2598107 RepID=UPI001D0C2994|nr:hypothetical protein [Methylobacterium sp. W2]MCC0807345.1 hypothetical protein [Methylobacterium sp. W2]